MGAAFVHITSRSPALSRLPNSKQASSSSGRYMEQADKTFPALLQNPLSWDDARSPCRPMTAGRGT